MRGKKERDRNEGGGRKGKGGNRGERRRQRETELWAAFFLPLLSLVKSLFEATFLPAVRCWRGEIMGKRKMSMWAVGTLH